MLRECGLDGRWEVIDQDELKYSSCDFRPCVMRAGLTRTVTV